jgi:hypothetical protein
MCEGLSGTAGIVRIFAVSSEVFGSFGDLALWTTGDPASTDPDVIAGGGSVDFDGLTMTATFDLVELVESTEPEEPPVAVPAGTASFNATLAPDGKPQILSSFTDRTGNRIVKGETSFQPRSVEGTLDVDLLTAPAAEYDMSDCFASSRTESSSITNPAANVAAVSRIFVTCGWESPEGSVVLGAVAGSVSNLEVFEGENRYLGLVEPVLTTSAFQAEYALIDLDTEEEVGAASASATLTRAEPLKVRDVIHGSMVDTSGWRLSVEGTLSVTTPNGTTSYVMDDASCFAADLRITTIETEPNGPKLKNDDPADAIALALGETVSVWTEASATEPEAPCVGGGPFSDSISHTGWWTFTGTGGDVTIDTAGSSFDTILGVYLSVDGGFEEIGCADDVFGPSPGEFSLQAAITVGTVAGTTYYIQAGGFGPSGSGQLVLTID